ncbi:MAG: hypothetical protein GC146_13570 [Limimaricola sp.]|uniref:2TM domain-containing protein n=1 Tax=Limimaricola sp. TaxID=2211665 RepID=UPI001D9F4837|nr:2TM domain-containing protein [Limimaricola sp.]MBI1418244.1 hypothetical protein [Limimaricola sp.]
MSTEADERLAARKRLEAKRGFSIHLVVYLLVNLLLVVIWAMGGRGSFWPAYAMAGWGIGVAIHGWAVYVQRPISEDDIRREMERGG